MTTNYLFSILKMKKLLLNLFIFILPLVCIFLFVEYKISNVYNIFNKKKIYFENNLNNIEILNLGSSHGIYDINPFYFSYQGFNAAIEAQSLYFDKRILLKYIDKMPKLKMVIIPISYHTFLSENLTKHNDIDRDFFYLHYWNIEHKDLPIIDVRRFSITSIYSYSALANIIRLGFKIDLDSNLEKTGFSHFDNFNPLKYISDSSGKKHVREQEKSFDSSKLIYIVNDFEDMLKELKKRNIKIVVLTTPVFHTYSDHCNYNYLEMKKNILLEKQEKYNYYIFDYFTDKRFTIEDFMDNDHLKITGATKFSKIIDSEIIKPILDTK